MNCLRCNTDNEDAARFCRNCGASLAVAVPVAHPPLARDEGLKDNLVYLLIVMGWEYFTYILWYIIQKVVVPFSGRFGGGSGARISTIYKTVGLVTDSITLLLLIVFAVLSRNTTARICLIVFAFLRLIFLVVYRLM